MTVFKSHNDEFATGKASGSTSLGSLTMSPYERTASWLLAFLWLCGSLTVCLVLLWLGQNLRYKPNSYDVTVEGENGRGAGLVRDAKAPGYSELANVDEPAGNELSEAGDDQPLPSTTVIDEAVVASIAEVGDIAVDNAGTSGVTGFRNSAIGRKGPRRDHRRPGPLSAEVNVIPRWERWEIQFVSTSVAAYARQLDFFGIELGAIGGQKEIDYASHLAKSTPDRRTGLPKDENRMYMAWQRGTLKAFDEQLLQRANINTSGRLIVQFIPPETENLLATLELQHAGGRSVKEFYKTVFGVRQTSTGWEFFIVDQKFRTVLTRT
jgi:hypothetical protein